MKSQLTNEQCLQYKWKTVTTQNIRSNIHQNENHPYHNYQQSNLRHNPYQTSCQSKKINNLSQRYSQNISNLLREMEEGINNNFNNIIQQLSKQQKYQIGNNIEQVQNYCNAKIKQINQNLAIMLIWFDERVELQSEIREIKQFIYQIDIHNNISKEKYQYNKLPMTSLLTRLKMSLKKQKKQYQTNIFNFLKTKNFKLQEENSKLHKLNQSMKPQLKMYENEKIVENQQWPKQIKTEIIQINKIRNTPQLQQLHKSQKDVLCEFALTNQKLTIKLQQEHKLYQQIQLKLKTIQKEYQLANVNLQKLQLQVQILNNQIKQFKKQKNHSFIISSKIIHQIITANQKYMNPQSKQILKNDPIHTLNHYCPNKNAAFFLGQCLQNEEDFRFYLSQTIEKTQSKMIKFTRFIYRFDPLSKVNIHKYVDGIPNLVLIVKTVEGYHVASFSQASVSSKGTSSGKGLLISLTNRRYYHLQIGKKPLTYDAVYLIFGSSEARVNHNQLKFFSNFGTSNGYFKCGSDRINDLLGQGSKKDVDLVCYEIYQVVFQ